MSGSRKLIIGNWKMHFSVKQATAFARRLADKSIPAGVNVGVAPHTLSLTEVSAALKDTAIKVVAQNAYSQDEGAFTGEISMPMLRGVAKYALIGHSERRHIFHEQNELIRAKVAAAVRSGVIPVLCIGETLLERQHGQTSQVLYDQLNVGLANLTSDEVSRVVIAYEPVWAIGTGQFARPDDVTKVATKIRQDLHALYGENTARAVTLLYGGSVSKDNALSYLDILEIDGLLVGGASLNIATFWPIVEAAQTDTGIPRKIPVKEQSATK